MHGIDGKRVFIVLQSFSTVVLYRQQLFIKSFLAAILICGKAHRHHVSHNIIALVSSITIPMFPWNVSSAKYFLIYMVVLRWK